MNWVIITGAGSGIGRAAAKKFAEHGYGLILLGRRQEALEETKNHIGGQCFCLAFDQSQKEDHSQLLAKLKALEITSISALINNAGCFTQGESMKKEWEDWEHTFATNVFGPAYLTKTLSPYFVDHHSAIVNVSSTLGHRPTLGTALYSASKAAINNWTRALSLELAPRGIRVNAVCPGIVDTPIHSFYGLPEEKKNQALIEMAGLQPLGRIGTPDEVARAIYFLASPQSSWTTGALLDVDGGINL